MRLIRNAMHRLHPAAKSLPCGVDPNGRVPESFFCVRPVDVDLSSISQMPPVRDFIVSAVMAEAKVDILRPDSRKPNAEQEWKLVRWRLGLRDPILQEHQTGKAPAASRLTRKRSRSASP